jgi:hypothetical protein
MRKKRKTERTSRGRNRIGARLVVICEVLVGEVAFARALRVLILMLRFCRMKHTDSEKNLKHTDYINAARYCRLYFGGALAEVLAELPLELVSLFLASHR